MKNKFELMLESYLNGDEKRSEELFHNIVVEASTKIYRDYELSKAYDDNDLDDEDRDDIGGDASDDFIDDVEDEDAYENDGDSDEYNYDDEDEDELNPDLEDRVTELENKADEIQTELDGFEADYKNQLSMLDRYEADEAESDSDSYEDREVEDEDEDKDEDEDADKYADEYDEEELQKEAVLREYAELIKVGALKNEEPAGTNKRSPTANPKYPDMGAEPVDFSKPVSQKEEKIKVGELASEDEIQNRPGRKKAKLKPVSYKEPKDIKSKSVLD